MKRSEKEEGDGRLTVHHDTLKHKKKMIKQEEGIKGVIVEADRNKKTRKET